MGERRRSSWAALTATVCSTQVACSWLWLQCGPCQTCTGAANWPLAICNAATLPRASGMSWSAWDPGCDCSLTDCLWRSIHQTSDTCGRVVTMSCVAQKACGSSSIISVRGRADTNVLRLCASGTEAGLIPATATRLKETASVDLFAEALVEHGTALFDRWHKNAIAKVRAVVLRKRSVDLGWARHVFSCFATTPAWSMTGWSSHFHAQTSLQRSRWSG